MRDSVWPITQVSSSKTSRRLTENVRDFGPLLLSTVQTEAKTGLLFTSSRGFPRSRKNPGPLINALDRWLQAGPSDAPIVEDWLVAAEP